MNIAMIGGGSVAGPEWVPAIDMVKVPSAAEIAAPDPALKIANFRSARNDARVIAHFWRYGRRNSMIR